MSRPYSKVYFIHDAQFDGEKRNAGTYLELVGLEPVLPTMHYRAVRRYQVRGKLGEDVKVEMGTGPQVFKGGQVFELIDGMILGTYLDQQQAELRFRGGVSGAPYEFPIPENVLELDGGFFPGRQ